MIYAQDYIRKVIDKGITECLGWKKEHALMAIAMMMYNDRYEKKMKRR